MGFQGGGVPGGTVVIGGFVGAVVYRTTPQTIQSGGAGTAVSFDASSIDTHGFHSTPAGLVVPAGLDGWYDADAQLRWLAAATGIREAFLTVNGAPPVPAPDKRDPGSAAAETFQQVSGTFHLAVGDTLRAVAFQDSGAPRDLNSSAAGYLWLALRFLGQ